MLNVIDALNWRYSTKSFDPTKKISAEDMAKVKTILRMSPSSTNVQPWHFIIATSDEGKARVAKGTQGIYAFNTPKVLNASSAIIFCARTDVKEDYMQHLLHREEQDGRFPNEYVKKGNAAGRKMFADLHQYELKDQQHWMEKQVYLNIGNFLLGVATLGIDAVPMEGLDLKALDAEFGLHEKGFTAICMVSIGYRNEQDFNTPNKTPKSRLPESEAITVI